MKMKDFAKWWWEFDAPWWAWLLLIVLVGLFPIHIHIQF